MNRKPGKVLPDGYQNRENLYACLPCIKGWWVETCQAIANLADISKRRDSFSFGMLGSVFYTIYEYSMCPLKSQVNFTSYYSMSNVITFYVLDVFIVQQRTPVQCEYYIHKTGGVAEFWFLNRKKKCQFDDILYSSYARDQRHKQRL